MPNRVLPRRLPIVCPRQGKGGGISAVRQILFIVFDVLETLLRISRRCFRYRGEQGPGFPPCRAFVAGFGPNHAQVVGSTGGDPARLRGRGFQSGRFPAGAALPGQGRLRLCRGGDNGFQPAAVFFHGRSSASALCPWPCWPWHRYRGAMRQGFDRMAKNRGLADITLCGCLVRPSSI